MPLEIERKFILRAMPSGITSSGMQLTQGYLKEDPACAIRIRSVSFNGRQEEFLTIKGKSSPDGRSRHEFETPVPQAEAGYLLSLCEGAPIEKIRYHYHWQGYRWEIDDFKGRNEGLLLAEIELTTPAQEVICFPEIQREVTGMARYYNMALRKHPYQDWTQREKEGEA